MSKLNERKGVNVADFLKKKKVRDATKAKNINKKAIEKKSVAITVSSKGKKKEVKVVKKPVTTKKVVEKDPKKPNKNKVSLFRFVKADAIKEKGKLLQFIKWYSIPKEVKDIKTQDQFAKQIGLGADTVSNWKNLEGFYEEVEVYHFNVMKRFLNDVGMGMVKAAKNGNAKAMELFYEVYMKWSRKLMLEDVTPERIITDEEKLKIDHALKNIGLAQIISDDEDFEDE